MRARMGKTAKIILKNETTSRKLLSKIIEAGKEQSTKRIRASVSDDKNEYTFREMSIQ